VLRRKEVYLPKAEAIPWWIMMLFLQVNRLDQIKQISDLRDPSEFFFPSQGKNPPKITKCASYQHKAIVIYKEGRFRR